MYNTFFEDLTPSQYQSIYRYNKAKLNNIIANTVQRMRSYDLLNAQYICEESEQYISSAVGDAKANHEMQRKFANEIFSGDLHKHMREQSKPFKKFVAYTIDLIVCGITVDVLVTNSNSEQVKVELGQGSKAYAINYAMILSAIDLLSKMGINTSRASFELATIQKPKLYTKYELASAMEYIVSVFEDIEDAALDEVDFIAHPTLKGVYLARVGYNGAPLIQFPFPEIDRLNVPFFSSNELSDIFKLKDSDFKEITDDLYPSTKTYGWRSLTIEKLFINLVGHIGEHAHVL